jgi:hypothetical protein
MSTQEQKLDLSKSFEIEDDEELDGVPSFTLELAPDQDREQDQMIAFDTLALDKTAKFSQDESPPSPRIQLTMIYGVASLPWFMYFLCVLIIIIFIVTVVYLTFLSYAILSSDPPSSPLMPSSSSTGFNL